MEFSESTLAVYHNFLCHWDEFISGNDYLLGEISTIVVKEFKDYLLEHVSPNSADIYLAKFKYILKSTVDDELLLRNPADKVRIKTQ